MGHKCKTKERLPRKKKKFFKKFLIGTQGIIYRGFMDMTTSCGISSEYHRFKKLFPIYQRMNKYKRAFEVLSKYCDYSCEPIYINEDGRLCWYWENDSDYGGSSGIMPFCYSKEEAGDTWAFSEVERLLRFASDSEEYDEDDNPIPFVFPENIKTDIDLIKYLQSC